MNQTKITNLIARGGIEGWTEVGENDNEYLTKTYDFDSFE
jgi:hypothetical protein